MKKNILGQKIGSQRGFTLLYTLLVVSLVLAVTSSIFGIISKEVTLSGYARDSQIAYYAAESAAECVLFHALNGGTFEGEDIICNNLTVSGVTMNTTFRVNFKEITACADVIVLDDQPPSTKIESRGYNTCANTIRRVERGVRVVF